MEIADLKSTNGTYVNSRKISGPTPIAASDRVYVGDFLIGIEGPGGASSDFSRLQRRAAVGQRDDDQRCAPLADAPTPAPAALRLRRVAVAKRRRR